IALFRKHLQPLPVADAKRLTAYLRDLDSDQFTVREKAKQELEKLGEAAEPALRRVLEAQPSAEVRRQVMQLLDRLGGPDRLRRSRTLEVLEWIGTAEARKVLEALADGAPDAWQTR